LRRSLFVETDPRVHTVRLSISADFGTASLESIDIIP
jgi:hypothetical protein